MKNVWILSCFCATIVMEKSVRYVILSVGMYYKKGALA